MQLCFQLCVLIQKDDDDGYSDVLNNVFNGHWKPSLWLFELHTFISFIVINCKAVKADIAANRVTTQERDFSRCQLPNLLQFAWHWTIRVCFDVYSCGWKKHPTECETASCELLSHFSQQMATKGTSAGTSADLHRTPCVCIHAHVHESEFVHLRHLARKTASTGRLLEDRGRWRCWGRRPNTQERQGGTESEYDR